MQEFDFVIRDEIGIHARPAGLLAREASAMSSVVTVECNGKKAEAKKLFDVLELGGRRTKKRRKETSAVF